MAMSCQIVRLGIYDVWNGTDNSQALGTHRTTENAMIMFVFGREH